MTDRPAAFFLAILFTCCAYAQGPTGPELLGEAVPGNVAEPDTRKVFIVQLRSPSAAEYHAELVQPLAATAKPAPGEPRVTRLQKHSAPIRQYVAKLRDEQAAVIDRAGPGLKPVYSYTYGLNGFAAEMSLSQAQKLRENDEVLHVWEDEVRPLATSHSPHFLELFNADAGLRSARELDGEGLVIGIIDSGVAPEHPALQETREADKPRLCRSSWAETSLLGRWLCRRYERLPDVLAYEPPEDWNGTCETGERFEETDCNNKLIGARWFIDGAESTGLIDDGEIRSPRDADGHGTHTATTAAGNPVNASIFGTEIGNVQGIAPRARVAVYKACWLRPGTTRASCNTSDLARAVEAAVEDGVDIISYSVGSTMREVTAPDDLALLAATKAGVLAVVAAGNEGPALGTIGSPASGPWVMTVAASTRTGATYSEGYEITTPINIAGLYATRESDFSPALADKGPIEASLVLVNDDTDTTSDGCEPIVNSDEVAGNIALMQRSGCLFTDMVANAEDAGAVAALIYNISGGPVLMTGEQGLVDIPALMIGQADANLFLAELDAGVDIDVRLDKTLRFERPETGNVMASFSGRGPGYLGDIIKPDVTAPGVNIVAGFTPDAANATPGENFAYLSGTSMATPHVSGAAALLRQAHPDWSPAALKSALMTTSRQNLALPNSSAAPNPFDFGSGHVVPNAAFDPGLVYDVDIAEYDALLDGSLAVDEFNLPSIAVSRLIGSETVTRQVTNVGDDTETFSIIVNAPPGFSVVVNPPSLSVMPGATASFDVTISNETAPLDLWWFGDLTWSNEDHDVYSPIAVRAASISAPSEIVRAGGSGTETFPVTFGYSGAYTPRVHGLNLPRIANRFVDNDPTKNFTPRLDNGVTGIRVPIDADQLFLRFSLFDALTDGDDDLDMYVYYCGTSGATCRRIGESGSQTSDEQFNLFNPPAGFYDVYVHGFATDEVSGGPGANFSLLAWQLGNTDDPGNMTASGPAFVSTGQTADVSVDWSNLQSQTIYLGAVSHVTPQGVRGVTLLTIGN